MNKNLISTVLIICVVVLVGYFGYRYFTGSQTPTTNPDETRQVGQIKKVDLSSQPAWVQKLVVTAKSGRSANGLKNFTITATGIPAGTVASAQYVIQYETTNHGAQGALSTKPVDISGKTEFSKTIDLGTCSTKSCVTHEGVTSVDVELDFTGTSGDQFTWTGTIPL